MDMKKAFVSLGIGVLVVTGLIQSGVIDVNQVFTTGDAASGINLATDTHNEKWAQKTGSSQSNGGFAQSDNTHNQTAPQQAKLSSCPFGGVVVPGKVQEISVKRNCTTLIAEKIYTPTIETLDNPPQIKEVQPGRYRITAEGIRTQYYYANGSGNPPSGKYPQNVF